MRYQSPSFLRTFATGLMLALSPAVWATEAPLIRIVLAGDSTVTDNAGWGLGFKQFVDPARAEVINTARGGRSSMSFIKEGRWEKALALKADYYLIQFGHNDEPGKPGRSTTLEEYRSYMNRYVDEARAAGATPVLVTSLVRRQFDRANDHKINSSLETRVAIVKEIAAEKHVPLVDLHARSKELCERLGREGCLAFSPMKETDGKTVPDGTHLNARGYVLFGKLVVEELRAAVPALAPWLRTKPLNPEPKPGVAESDDADSAGGGGRPATESVSLAAAAEDPEPIAPIRAPFPMPQLERPVFPARVADVREHGAVAGGGVKNTEAFAAAIAACSAAGGGRVLVPAGKWLTGPIHLRSNIELHLAEGAELVFSDRFEDYLPVVLVRAGGIELYNYSPFIYARDCTNVAITGPGRLNGNARAWWAWAAKERRDLSQLAPRGVPVERRVFGTPADGIRPNFVVFMNCRDVLLEGFTIGSGANWTLHPVYCENVIVRRVHVLTDGPNNDGLDPDSCRNVLIEHCEFDTGDDCVVLKSGYNEDGWRVGRPMENLVMRWCTARRGHGGLAIGSEMSGDVRNVYVHDCDFTGTDRALRIKSRRGRGGVVENIRAENLRVQDLKREVVTLNMNYGSDRQHAANEKAPIFRNIVVRDIRGTGAPVAIWLAGLEDSPIQNVTFENISVTTTRGVIVTDAQGLRFDELALASEKGPAFALTNARDVVISRTRDAGQGTFLELNGAASTKVRIESCELGSARPPVITGPGVSADTVTINRGQKLVT